MSWFARHAAKVDLVAAASSASSRLRWGSPQAMLDVGEDRATMARAFAYLFGAGATLVLATLPLVDGAERFLPGLVGSALLAYAVVLLMVVRFDRLPSRLFHALPALGAVLVAVVAYSAGEHAFAAYSTLYCWVILSAFYLFTTRVAAVSLFVAIVAYGSSLALRIGVGRGPLLAWIAGVATLGVAAVLLALLRGRMESLVKAMTLDIRARQRSERVLRESQDRLEDLNGELQLQSAIAANMVEGVALIRASDARIIYTNAAFDQMFGYSADELDEQPVSLLNAVEVEGDETPILSALAASGFWSGEVHPVKKDGTDFWCRANISTFMPPGHEPVWIAVYTDVTESKRIEREADRLKDEFFAAVSHELRTPLTSVVGYTDLLLSGDAGELTDQQRHFLEITERNAKRQLRLVADLLFVSQIEAGKLAIERGDVDLQSLVEEAVEAALPAAEKKEIALVLAAERIPYYAGDRDRLAQLVDNLVSNALKFTPRRGHVELELAARGDHVALSVKNTGSHIPPTERERLFDRFFRSSVASEQAIPGIGLGLTISKAIVDAHGGEIAIESEERLGTTFHVELPLNGALHSERPMNSERQVARST